MGGTNVREGERFWKDVFRLPTAELDLACPLVDTQWGFRAGRSTISALLSTVTHWFEILDAGMDICTVFFDYRKAFDTMPHQPLLEKLVALDLNRHVIQCCCLSCE